MTREDFCNKIEVKCFECGEMCDKYNNAECVEDLCKKNLVAEFEAEIRAKAIDKLVNCLCQYNLGAICLTSEQNESIWRDIREIAEQMKGGAENES